MKKLLYSFVIVLVGLLALFTISQLSIAQNKSEATTETKNQKGLKKTNLFQPRLSNSIFLPPDVIFTHEILDGSGYGPRYYSGQSTNIGAWWQGCESTPMTGGRYDCDRRYNYGTFTLTAAAELSAVHVWIGGFNNWGLPSEPNLKLEVYLGNPTSSATPTALLATSNPLVVGDSYPTGSERSFTFASPVTLSSGTPYTFRLFLPSGIRGDLGSSSAYALYGVTLVPTVTQFTQQGPKLVGTGAGGNARQGRSVSLSADGNTAIVGSGEGSSDGAAWIWTRSGGVWTQQGNKLVGSGAVGSAQEGISVSLSADGNTAIVGRYSDNSNTGAAWIWTRSGGVWTQQGNKLVGSGTVGNAAQGWSVSLSADGNTAIVGGWTDNSHAGAAWIWTRSGGVWTQQGNKLVGSGAVGSALQGRSVSISADGNTAIVGGIYDNSNVGAAWVWTRNGGVWTQQGNKLVGSGAVGNAEQGYSVSISADGNTAIVGGWADNSIDGAAWIWTRSGGVWTQQGNKLVGSDAEGNARQGWSVSLSADGNTAIIGGPVDNSTGAAWVWTRSGGVWTQQGNKLVGSGALGNAVQGWSVSLSADGNTAFVGGLADNDLAGAAWVFINPNPVPSISNITSPVAVNQTTNLVVNGANFKNNFTAVVTTPSGTFSIAAAGLTFVSSSQVRVQVNMSGTPPYPATLRITNPGNQSATGQFQVVSTTNPPPTITSISPSQIPVNQPLILTVQGQNFRQNFTARVQGLEIAPAGLTFVNSNEVLVQVTMGGTPPYQASLVLTNPDGQMATSSFNVSNTPPNTNFPQASFTFSPNNPNVNQSVQFNSTSSGQGLSYFWDFQSDGVTDSTVQNPTFAFNTAGARNVSLRVSNSYGTDVATNSVSVGTTSTTAPVVTNIIRTFPGLYFLKNTNSTNFFDIRVNWNGSPGRVRIQLNNNSPIEINGTANGVCHPFNLNTSFTPSWAPSIIKITPINGQGIAGDTSIQTIYVFPYETWLNEAVADLGESIIQRNIINSQTGCGSNITNPTSTGEIKANIRYSFPPVAINYRFPGNVPNIIPLFGGHPLGLNNVRGEFLLEASNNGTGRLQLQGGGQFTAMGAQLDKLFVKGSGTVGTDYRGLIVREANFELGITGKLKQERGVLTAFPQLAPLTNLPVVGGIFRQFNERAKIFGEIQPNLAANFTWKHDPADRRLKFVNGTGRLGIETSLGINFTPINGLSVEPFIGSGGSLDLAVPQPYLRAAELNMRGGVRFRAFFYSSEITLDYRCRWQHPNPGMTCGTNPLINDLNLPFNSKFELINYDYRKFGGYEVFHPNAEETHKLEVKNESEQLASVSESGLINNLFPEAEPTILPVGNDRMLLWVRQNPNLPVLQSTEIAWSYYNGTSWSNPAVVVSDTRSEFSPVAGVDANGKVVAAWLRIKDPAFNINIENLEQLPLYSKQIEVVSAIFDPVTQVWGTETVLTDDLAFDTSLHLSSDNTGRLLLTWQSNPSGEFMADSANPATLKYSFWNGASWNAVGTIANNLTNIGEHVVAVKGNNAFVIVPRDPNLNVLNDRLLEIYSWNGSVWSGATVFAGGNTDNFLPSAVYDANSEGQIVWLRGADLVQATLTNPTPRIIRQASESMGFYNARLLINPQGNLTLVWQEVSDNGPANIYAILYDTASQTWSEDLRLNDSDWLSKNASSYYGSDGKLRMAYLATQILRRTITTTIDGETVEIPNVPENGQTDLRLLEHSLINDLATTDADLALSPQFPRAGEMVMTTLKLRNAGNFSLNNFNIKLYAGNPSSGGILLSNIRVAEQLAAGEIRTVTLSFTNPQTPRNIVAVVDADNEINEFSEANNLATVYFENTPPVAIATASVTSGNVPLTVNFDASSSYDSDGDALSFSWTFADGTSSVSGATASHLFEQIGLYPVTVSVADSRGAVSSATVNVNVGCNLITISPASLPIGSTTVGYSQNLSATGGIAPYSFAVTSGALPMGMTLTPDGLLSGTPIEAGTFNVTVSSTYANGCPGSRDYTLTINQTRKSVFDFDGDGKTDIGIFRPAPGEWWYLKSSNGGNFAAQFGASTDKIVPADYTGDGKADIAFWRPSTGQWFILRSEDLSFFAFPFGSSGDVPVPADYDGDGKADAAVFRPSTTTWFINKSSGGTDIIGFGAAGDKPVVGDYDGDSKADIAIFRPNGTNGAEWWIRRSSNQTVFATQFGASTDKAVQGDYTGDGKTDIAFWQPSTGFWYILRSEDFSFYAFPFGANGDVPVSGDYDGDGKFDVAVFRPSNSTWFIQRTTAGTLITQFGVTGDVPVPNAFIP